jgi:hypothetical protein
MPIRSFRAADGVLWQVWNVVPDRGDTAEQRIGYDRRSPDPVFRYTGPERRRPQERRLAPLLLSQQLASGWLTFQCPTEKRRLAPIPQRWDELSEAELEKLCQSARICAPAIHPDPPPSPPQS